MIAPYNNSMRLGQGFNSYTQQICLDKAVLPDTEYNRELIAAQAAKKPVTLSDGSSKPSAGQPAQILEAQAPQEVESLDGSSSEGSKASKEPDNVDIQRSELLHGSEKQGTKPVQVLPWVKPQIVTYSSRFVDKLSDVTGQCAKQYRPSDNADICRCYEHLRILVHQDRDHRRKGKWFICRQ